MESFFVWKIPNCVFILVFVCGCSHHKSPNNFPSYPHPANPCVSVLPIEIPKTLDIDEGDLPGNSDQEPKMHQGNHALNDTE